MAWLATLRAWAKAVKRDVVALWLAVRDPRTPLPAKLVAVVVVAYALSPLDLIPDFIPVLGYVDDLLLVPLGIVLAVALIPVALMDELRKRALDIVERPVSRGGMIAVMVVWILALVWMVRWVYF